MRKTSLYTAKEWLKLEPIIWYFKEKRNDAISRSFVNSRPEQLEDFIQQNKQLTGKDIAIVVAFNSPWVLEVLLPAMKHYVPDAHVLVCDNSNDAALRPEIEAVCRHANVPYFPLPSNPEKHPCRSHGIALNWIYYNLIKKLKPARFACIDHDLIPFKPVSMAALLATQPVYGRLVEQEWAWYLWAGFSMFDYQTVQEKKLNFLNDRANNLDTAGRNWKPFLQYLDKDQLRQASDEFYTFRDPNTLQEEQAQVIDGSWLHLKGVGMRKNRKNTFGSKAAFYEKLFQYVEEGQSLSDFIVTDKS